MNLFGVLFKSGVSNLFSEPSKDKELIGLPTKQVFINGLPRDPPGAAQDISPAELLQNIWGSCYWRVPWNFHGFVSVTAIFYTTANSAAHTIRHRIEAGSCDESITAHTQQVDQNETMRANEYECRDIYPLLTTVFDALVVGDIMHYMVQNRDATRTFFIGLDVRYI